MRVNPDHNSSMLAALERVTESQNTVLQELSSGKKIQRPSDDPAGMAALVEVQASDSTTTQYLSTISALRSQTQAADSSLNSATLLLERALSLGVRGGTGTLSDSDREAIACELDGISTQLRGIGNSTIQGIYLFSGSSTTTTPFVTSGGQVTYQGSNHSNEVAIGDGVKVEANIAGSDVFGDDVTGAFATLTKVAQAIRNQTSVDSALDDLRNAQQKVSGARVICGNALNQIDSTEAMLNERHLQFAQQETDLAGSDLADVATRLSAAETARSALLSTIARGNALNLFDLLR